MNAWPWWCRSGIAVLVVMGIVGFIEFLFARVTGYDPVAFFSFLAGWCACRAWWFFIDGGI
jgi:hypothetical protein